MKDLRLITPLEGQKNWGNAINQNFGTLLQRYNALCSEVQGMRTEFDELDTLNIQNDKYLYINVDSNIFINKSSDWDNPSLTSVFNPDSANYRSYQAWFVKTSNDQELKYKTHPNGDDMIWQTGDLLIIHKQTSSTSSLGTTTTVIEQWKNIMGGYFKPAIGYNIDTEGKLTRSYIKSPSFSTEQEYSINVPLMHWRPERYDPTTGQLEFAPYYINASGDSVLLKDIDVKPVSITYVTKGGGNYTTIPVDENVVEIGTPFNNDNSEDMENIGFDIHFNDSDNNVLYFPYSYEKTEDKKLKITIQRNGFEGEIKVRMNIFKGESYEI